MTKNDRFVSKQSGSGLRSFSWHSQTWWDTVPNWPSEEWWGLVSNTLWAYQNKWFFQKSSLDFRSAISASFSRYGKYHERNSFIVQEQAWLMQYIINTSILWCSKSKHALNILMNMQYIGVTPVLQRSKLKDALKILMSMAELGMDEESDWLIAEEARGETVVARPLEFKLSCKGQKLQSGSIVLLAQYESPVCLIILILLIGEKSKKFQKICDAERH